MAKDIKTNIVIGGKTAKSLQKAFGQTEKGAQQIEKAYQSVKNVGVKAFKAIGLAVTASVGSLIAAAETTREFRQDLNRMYTNAEKAKLSLAETDAGLKNLYSVSGEFDSANEAMSNLIATGYKGKDLVKVIEAVNGASIKWQDTIKQESLADSIQESIASGELTGQFSEIMSRSGMTADSMELFKEKLSAASTQAERQKLVLNWLSKSGLADVNAAYRENNKELIAAYEADLKYQKSLAEVGAAAEPLAAILKGGMGSALSYIAGKLKGVDFSKVSAAMEKLGTLGKEAFDKIWAALAKIDWNSVINAAVSILTVFSNIFNFVVNNWSLISPIIYGIVGAMAAYKSIMLITNTVTAISNGLKIASAAAAALQTGATLSQAAAAGVATAAQLGLNAAFLASPITWIVLGIGAVIAVIAIIAKKVGGFKKLWEIAWGGIKTAFSVAKDFIVGGLQAVVDFIQPVIDWVDKLLGKLGKVGDGIKTAAKYSPVGLVYQGIKKITGNALGSTITRPTLTWVGEGGDTETIVPHNNKPRSQALALEAVKGTGVSVGGNTFVFSPTVYAGGMSETKLRGIMLDLMEDFKAKMGEYRQNEERLAF